ncbi:hypothetical protein FLCU109888_10635 [Flavobacterium cucumis]|uniref:Outer membrane translocation and assembly module TamA n=1 Tax=Flavobacterium cucumis TaxID=416016 RepID=A0A1M7ZWV0_9FLAO|nr:hypothetical protein [Flavobacterium cucumis]SHO73354.1 Outer membrane translocation and assembly module TamA [Flavobacterium cucumis]
MKFIILLIVCFYFQISLGQNFYLKIEGISKKENSTIDSIEYKSKHVSVVQILEEQKRFENKLTNQGFFDWILLEQKKTNDSSFIFKYSLGNSIKNITIHTGNLAAEEKSLLQLKNDTITIISNEIENFMKTKINLLEKKGYALANLKLANQRRIKNSLISDLQLKLNSKRNITDIIIVGYEKFPTGIKKAITKKAKKATFNKDNLKQINDTFKQLQFVNQLKYPEILFTQDSTKIFVYIEKSKPNKFDGFIGFSNDNQNKLTFNGYLDLKLQNILNTGEKFNLYWKNDGNRQTSFNIGTELPYIFKTPIGIKANLRIFKQDSTFQNTITDLNLGYYFNYNTKAFIGYQKSTSIDIQNSNSFRLNDFTNTFITTSFEYTDFNNENFIFPEKARIYLKTGLGNRNITSKKTSQFFTQLDLNYNFNLNSKNSIYLRNQTFYLQSDDYVINELFRFGGINSIRGFNENSLQANAYSGILAEYRYLIASNLYLHSITDFGYFQDKTSNVEDQLFGFGFGFGLFTQNGFFNLVYANGSTNKQDIKLNNSIFHISFKTIF